MLQLGVAAQRPSARSAGILSRAFLRAARELSLSQKDAARIIGVSEATLSRLARGRPLDPESKQGELAVLFLRLYRSLDTLIGGSANNARRWLHAHNLHLDGTPAELIRGVPGLIHVVDYLDALRGKL